MLTADVTVRDASRADFDQWCDLWTQYNAFYGRHGPTALSEEITLITWDRFFDPNTPVHCLVAEYDGRLVGFAHYVFHINTITIEDTCYLQDLFSDPPLRRQGIGRRLITGFFESARRAGTQGVYWHTQSSNLTAMRLYDNVATNTEFVVYRTSVSKH